MEERISRSLSRLAETGDYTVKDDQTVRQAAHAILLELSREGDDDYAWLANSLDVASHRYLYRLTLAHIVRLKRCIDWKTPRRRYPARKPTASSWKSNTHACS